MIHRGYRYRLDPTAEQAALFAQFAGVCRLVYNLGLEQRRDHWRRFRSVTGSSISYISQARELTELRAGCDWIAAVSQTCQQQALRDLDRAYARWFSGTGGYPSPRRKGRNDTFRFQGREVEVRRLNGRWSQVRLPKIGWVRYRDTRDPAGSIRNVTVSLEANGWHISFGLEIAHEVPASICPPVGIDRGVVSTLVLSTGERFSLPASLNALERRLRHARKTLSRRRRGSGRYAMARRRVAVLEARRARIRRDWHHRVSHDLSRRFGTVVPEDLNIGNMTASARGTADEPGSNVRQKAGLNRAILNQGWHMFETLLGYKLEKRGGHLCTVPAHHTSQTCSACGAIDGESRESQATFACRTCGHRMNADHNAAINILRRNTSSMVVEEGHWLSFEAITRKGGYAPENPPASAGGRC